MESNMTDKALDPAAFSKVEFPGVYLVEIEVRGYITVEVTAESKEAAREQAGEIVDGWEDDGYPDIDQVWHTSVWETYQKPGLYRILRDGKPFQVSRLTPGDLPREPNERGF